jgi:hypothetical protein
VINGLPGFTGTSLPAWVIAAELYHISRILVNIILSLTIHPIMAS